ncbi:PREDICTED: cancer/testis antigen 47A-like [Chinchilla lanigera]|uniref:cancer/testis antigen 47A-like n=1 Tax=Chinchilla lanigera TaxID=34839 RepID=UPI00038EA790|nr:PREDICTED: cancer/testis antigen 47A-like [Chinchilla lanigera]
MSATGNGDPTPNDPDSRVSLAAEGAEAAGVDEGVGLNSGTNVGSVAEGSEAQVASGAQALGPRVVEEGVRLEAGSAASSSSSSSSIGPAEEEEGGDGVMNRVVDPWQFPLLNFRITFMELANALLQRMQHNDHLLIRPYEGSLRLRRSAPNAASRPRPRPSLRPRLLPVLPMPSGPRGPAIPQVRAPGEGEAQAPAVEAVVSAPAVEEPRACAGATAMLAEASKEAMKETAKSGKQVAKDSKGEEHVEVTQNPQENWSGDDDFGGVEEREAEEEGEKENENQQEPEKDTDAAGGSLGKPGSED